MNYWGFEERNSSNKLRFFRRGKKSFFEEFWLSDKSSAS